MSQIGVAIVPGSITATWIPHGRSSRRSVSEKPSSAELRGGVGAEQRDGDLAADRADVDDPPARGAQLRQERLRDGDLADQVDLDLAAEVVDRLVLDRRGDGDAGVVDEAGEAAPPVASRTVARRRGDRVRVGHVDA